jgi:mono/diheme cytochrome c family protein
MKKTILAFAGLSCSLLTAFAADVDFVKQIQPIFQKSCIECHGPDKQKGKLRLDNKEAALKGGEDGPCIIPKDAAKSDLYRRITLPKDSDDVMPNKGDLLTKEQTDLIRDWINQGAIWPENTKPAKVAAAAPSAPVAELPKDFKPSAQESDAIAKLAKSGIEVRLVAANIPWRDANLRNQGTNITDAAIAPLKDIKSLVDLNLATTKITDAGLDAIKDLPYLQRLHLELTSVTDAGLAKLKGLTNLSYLNLYGTTITDAGLENLKGMGYLRNLYLFQSKVTTAGVASLKHALPHLDISTGWELEVPVKKVEIKDEKKEEKKEAKTEEKKDEKKEPKKEEKKEDPAKK